MAKLKASYSLGDRKKEAVEKTTRQGRGRRSRPKRGRKPYRGQG